jgi:hypothetical protein
MFPLLLIRLKRALNYHYMIKANDLPPEFLAFFLVPIRGMCVLLCIIGLLSKSTSQISLISRNLIRIALADVKDE